MADDLEEGSQWMLERRWWPDDARQGAGEVFDNAQCGAIRCR